MILSAFFGHLHDFQHTLSSKHDDPTEDGFETARRELDAAVSGLRHANRSDYLPLGLLTRALCSFAEASFFATSGAKAVEVGKATKDEPSRKQAVECIARAQQDLDEAWEIAERGPMRLFMADIHLYRARLFGRPKSPFTPSLSPLDGERVVADRERGIAYPWDSPEADLKAAEKLIKNCGYHRRDEELADAKKALGL